MLYKANTKHTFFKDIQNVVLKYVGIDDLVENMVSKLGDVKSAYIIGDYANGIDSGIIDLVLIGEIKQDILNKLTSKTKALINRLGHPLVSSSVHDKDEIIEYTTDPKAIYERYVNKVDVVIDCGYGNNVASTVIDCTKEENKIIRQGAGIIN